MEFATSKKLRLRAGEILAKVRAGGRFIITYRGKPVALLVPAEKEEAGFSPALTPKRGRILNGRWKIPHRTTPAGGKRFGKAGGKNDLFGLRHILDRLTLPVRPKI